MVVQSLFTVHGSPFYDFISLDVNKTTTELSASSSFQASIRNEGGRNKTNFSIGDEVIIYATSGNIWSDAGSTVPYSGNRVFTGILEDIKFRGKGVTEYIELAGRDYSARLQDMTVEPEVYTLLQAGSIVKDIINKYTTNITTNNVQVTGSAIARIKFNQLGVYDAVMQLCDLKGYVAYVDNYKDLHFEPIGSISTGLTFDSGNVLNADFKTQRDTLYNEIWVYGDRYLDGFKETSTAGSPLGGSIFTLLYKPFNTQVTVSGGIVQPGGVYNMNVGGSVIKYFVDFDNQQIIFTSGTNFGLNIPASGNSVVIDYQRLLPVVKVGADDVSVSQYGKRRKIIKDQTIKDPTSAVELMKAELAKYANPIIQGNLKPKASNVINGVNVAQGCVINLPNHNINNQTYQIISADYSFSEENLLDDTVLSLRVNRNLPSMETTLRDIVAAIKKLQTDQITDSDLLTRYQISTGSLGIRASGLSVYTRSIGSSRIYGHGVTGSNVVGAGSVTVLDTIANMNANGGINGTAYGIAFNSLINGNIIGLVKDATVLGSSAYIWNSSKATIGGGSFIGGGSVVTFTTAIPMTSGVAYYAIVDNGGNAYQPRKIDPYAALPVTGSRIKVIGDSLDDTTVVRNVVGVFTNIYSAGSVTYWGSGNGIYGSGGSYMHPPHFYGDFKGTLTKVWSGGYP